MTSIDVLLITANVLNNAYMWHRIANRPQIITVTYCHNFGQIVGILKITSWFYYKLQLHILENCFI